MQRRNRSFVSGLVVGVVAGLMAGAIGVAHSATGKKAWDRFGNMFQAGYIAGFLDCVRLAKGMDQQGYIATNYTLPYNAKPTHFQAWVNEAYKDPKAADRTIPQMLVLAGYKLQAQFGPEQPQGSAQMSAMQQVIDARRRAIVEAERAKKELEAAKAADAANAEKSGSAPATLSGGAAPAVDNGVETKPGEISPVK